MQTEKVSITRKQCTDMGMVMTLIALGGGLFFEIQFLIEIAILLLIINMIIPRVFRPLAIVWFGLSGMLGKVISGIMLGIIFFTIVTPVALIRRLLGIDNLKLKGFKDSKNTAYINRKHKFVAEDLIHPY